MDATMTTRSYVDTDDVMAPDERHRFLIDLYRARLTRLLCGEHIITNGLAPAEQRRLRSRAVLTTVRALTELGEGAAASDLLRQAPRP